MEAKPPQPEGSPPPFDPAQGRPEPTVHKRKISRWLFWVAGAVLGAILIICLSFTAIVTAIIRHELQAEIATNLNATLEIDTLSYEPFLGVKIGHAELSTPGPDGSPVPVMELGGLQVNLAKLPLGGPILVKNCTIRDPRIDLVELPSGELQVEQNFFKPSTTPSSPIGKLSDVLQVGHFEVDNLAVRWSSWKSSSPPKLLGTLDMSADQNSAGVYNFHIAAAAKPLAEMTVDGSVDVDGTALSFKNFSATAQVPQENDLGSLPASLQAICKEYALAGSGLAMTVADGGHVAIDLGKSRWRIQGLSGAVKVTSQPPAEVASGEFDWSLSGGGPLPGANAPLGPSYLAELDADTDFSLSNPANSKFSLNLPQLGHPITEAMTSIEFSNRTLKVKEFSARYGQETMQLQTTASLAGKQLTLEQFRLDVAGAQHLATVTMDGTVDLTAPTVLVKDFSVTAQVPTTDNLGLLPPALQAMCKQYGLAGSGAALTIADGGSLAIDQSKNRWRGQGLSGTVKLTSQPTAEVASGEFDWSLTGGGPLSRAGESLGPQYLEQLDGDTNFSLNTAVDGKFSVHSPRLGLPLTDVVTSIQFADRKLTVKEISARYGPQTLHLQTVAEFGPDHLKLDQFKFDVTADRPVAEVAIDGGLEINGTTLSFKKFSVTAQVPQGNDMGLLPASVQTFFNQYGLAGSGVAMTFADGGSVAIDQGKNRWRVKDLNGELKLTSQPPGQLATGTLDWKLTAGGPMPAAGKTLGPELLADLDPDTYFSLNSPANGNLSVHSPQLQQPLTNMATAVEYSKGTLTVKEISAHFGQQSVHLQTSLVIQSKLLKLQQFRLDVANGGVIIDSATIALNEPHDWTANVLVQHVDLRDLKQFIRIDDPQGRMSGITDAKLTVKGTMPAGTSPLATATGDGNFHVSDGDFLDIKILSAIVGKIAPGDQGIGRVGDAAGVFTVGGGSAKFSKIAVSCPIIGIQGDGTVGLVNDNPVDLSLIVAPFGDWKKAVDKANIPVIGQIFGQVVGTAQKALGQATQKAVLSFHVTGPAEHPSIQPVPAPALTKGASDLFGNMVNGVNGAKGNLLDLIQPQNNQKSK